MVVVAQRNVHTSDSNGCRVTSHADGAPSASNSAQCQQIVNNPWHIEHFSQCQVNKAAARVTHSQLHGASSFCLNSGAVGQLHWNGCPAKGRHGLTICRHVLACARVCQPRLEACWSWLHGSR